MCFRFGFKTEERNAGNMKAKCKKVSFNSVMLLKNFLTKQLLHSQIHKAKKAIVKKNKAYIFDDV